MRTLDVLGNAPTLVQQLSGVVGEELAKKIVSVAMESTNNSAEAEILIRDGIREISDQKFNYQHLKSDDSIT